MGIQRFPEIENNSSGSTGGLQGTWNASTNTPTLANTDTDKTGVMYQVSVGGTVNFGAGNITFEAKDIVVNNGVIWDKIDATDAVHSVNGNTGAVNLDKADIGLSNVDNTSDANKPISTATQSALDDKVDTDGSKVLSDNNYTTIEKNKLAGIEANADVTDATNVNSAGATMNTDTDVSGNSWVLDEDDFISDSDTKVPTQQSVKAYIDANAGGGEWLHEGVQSADEIVSSTTKTALTDMEFDIDGNCTYYYEAYIMFESSVNNLGYKFEAEVNNNNADWVREDIQFYNGASTELRQKEDGGGANLLNYNETVTGDISGFFVRGYFSISGSDRVEPNFAKKESTAGNLEIKKGSFIRMRIV